MAVRQLRNLFLFLVGLLILDRAIAWGLRRGFEQIRTGEAGGQINAALDHRHDDIMAFGSSLARYQIDPREFVRLNQTCFNAGCDGHDIYYARMLESLLLKRGCTARTFLYAVNWMDLHQKDLDRNRMFSIFIDDSPVIDEILIGNSIAERVKLLSHSYRFNSLPFSIARHWISPQDEGVLGFVPVEQDYLSRQADQVWFEADARGEKKIDDDQLLNSKLKLYADFVVAAKERSIRVIFVVPPTYRDGLPRGPLERQTLDAIQETVEASGAEFWRFDEGVVDDFRDKKWFGDQRHLNASGAKKLTTMIVDRMEKFGF